MIQKIKIGLTTIQIFITDDKTTYTEWSGDVITSPTIIGRTYGSFIWVKDKLNIPVVVHEIIHAIDFWMEKTLDNCNSSEVRAYAIQQVLDKYLKKVNNDSGNI